MNIKKAMAGGLAAITAGASLAFLTGAQLDTYVQTTDSTLSSPMIVIGSQAGDATNYPKDVVGAADLAAHVAGYATTDVAVGGGGASWTATGGVTLATPAKQLFVGSALNRGKDTLTDNDLPSDLKSGIFIDDAGTEYEYDQFVDIGSRTIKFDDSGGDLDDPALIVDLGTSSAAPYMTMKVIFEDELAFNASNSEGNALDIFGTSFTIDPSTDTDSIILRGGGTKITMLEGEKKTVNIDGKDREIEVTIVSSGSPDSAFIKVDGEADEINEDISKKINGVQIFMDVITASSKETVPGVVTMLLGARKLTLENGNEVKTGDNDEILDNTQVTITGGVGAVSSIEIAVGADDSNDDHLEAGQTVTDPIFGALKLAFSGISPSLEDEARNEIELNTAGDDEATVEFNDFNGNKKAFVFGFDSASGTSGTTISFKDDSSGTDGEIYVTEGTNFQKNDYFLTSVGDFDKLDFSHIWELSTVSGVTSSACNSDSKLVIQDFFSGKSVEINLGTDCQDDKIIDGKTFYFSVTPAATPSVNVTWETSATFSDPGSEHTIFPLLKGKNGEKIVIAAPADSLDLNTEVDLGDSFKLPTGNLFIDGFGGLSGSEAWVQVTPQVSGTNGTQANISVAGSLVTVGQVTYNISTVDSAADVRFRIYGPASSGLSVAAQANPSVMILQEQDDDDQYHAVVIPTSDNSDGVTIGTGSSIEFTDGVATMVSTDDNDVEEGVTEFGTFVRSNSDNQGWTKVWVPQHQAVAGVAMGADPMLTLGGSSGTVKAAVIIKSPVAKLDNEVSTSSLSSDLILVGGPCANKLVADLAAVNGSSIPACSAWNLQEGLIAEVSDAFGSGQKALVVAGTTADDTRTLVGKVMSGTLSYSA